MVCDLNVDPIWSGYDCFCYSLLYAKPVPSNRREHQTCEPQAPDNDP
jgi:hypothetical protein